MEEGVTSRGFRIRKFEDANGVGCSIQESSAMRGEGMLWLGAREIGLKRLDHGWRDVPLPRPEDRPGVEYLANTRMHLTQSQVRDLLPLLTHFAEHGELPDGDGAPREPGITLGRLNESWGRVDRHDCYHLAIQNRDEDAEEERAEFIAALRDFAALMGEPVSNEAHAPFAQECARAANSWADHAMTVNRYSDKTADWVCGIIAHRAVNGLRAALSA